MSNINYLPMYVTEPGSLGLLSNNDCNVRLNSSDLHKAQMETRYAPLNSSSIVTFVLILSINPLTVQNFQKADGSLLNYLVGYRVSTYQSSGRLLRIFVGWCRRCLGTKYLTARVSVFPKLALGNAT
jgi:hypothetical protein